MSHEFTTAATPRKDNGNVPVLVRSMAALYRHLPVKSGLTSLSFNRVMNRLMRDCADPIEAKLRDGNIIAVDPGDYHGRILYLFGTNDIKVSMNANAFLRKGDVFLDIGANYSTIGLTASHVVGSTGAIHLFEPQRRIADRVETAIRVGGYHNVTLHRIGLMDKDGELEIRGPVHHSGRATFASHEDMANFQVIDRCEVREIGSYVSPLVAGRSFGVKLDIEGSEPAVMPWLLSQPNLRFIIFEAAHNQSALFDQIRSTRATLFGLERDPLRLRIRRIDSFSDMSRFHDLIAVRVATDISIPNLIDPVKFNRFNLQ